MEGHFFSKANGDGVEQSQHGEDCDEHRIVDDRGISIGGCSNDVTSDCHDDKSQKELRPVSSVHNSSDKSAYLDTPQGELQHVGHYDDV